MTFQPKRPTYPFLYSFFGIPHIFAFQMGKSLKAYHTELEHTCMSSWAYFILSVCKEQFDMQEITRLHLSLCTVVEWLMALQKYPGPNPWNLLPYMVKRTLQVWLNSGSWDEEIILNSPTGPNVITGVFIRERQEGHHQRRCWT